MPFFKSMVGRMNSKERNERQYRRALTILGSISSLCMTTVVDVVVAYWGGDWLDEYFATGDHSMRLWCVLIAVGATVMAFINIVHTAMLNFEDEE